MFSEIHRGNKFDATNSHTFTFSKCCPNFFGMRGTHSVLQIRTLSSQSLSKVCEFPHDFLSETRTETHCRDGLIYNLPLHKI